MEWNELYNQSKQPALEDMADFIGGEAHGLWNSLFYYMDKSYNSKPKMFYSVCSGKPGWNIKFQKSGTAFGTLYPEEGSFSVFMVIGYKLEPIMEALKDKLSPEMRRNYENAQDFMKMGKWMMFRIQSESDLNDYKILMSAKMQPKA